MAGILDPKKRFLDTFVTQVGRDQLAHGELRFAFAVFSDHSTFYEESESDPTVAEDASGRIFFEPVNRPQDQIIPEFDDDGYISFPAGDFDLVNGQLLQVSGSTGKSIKGDQLISSASLAITDCRDSFAALDPLRTEEVYTKTTGFSLSEKSLTFTCTPEWPINPISPINVELEDEPSLWQDYKLTHVPNFMFLPPVNKVTNIQLREFSRLEQPEPATFDQMMRNISAPMPPITLGAMLRNDDKTNKGQQTIEFSSTSKDNNIVCQIFEVTSGSVEKLRMIDYGEFETDTPGVGKHVFFAGKLLKDDQGEDTFINLFSVVFE